MDTETLTVAVFSLDSLPLVFAIGLTVYVSALCLPDHYLLGVRLRNVVKRLFSPRESALPLLARDDELPLVAVQLAIYNEPRVVVGAMRCLAALDWPRDRLDIMVLDDSTDTSTAMISREVERLREQGVPIRMVHRDHRLEFKAGALDHGLSLTAAEYIAVFDVDYRPNQSFLRLMMRALIADSEAGFVQARLTYRNRNQNWLTRGQAVELDMSADFEQLARAEVGLPWAFNGTCGIWRRAAIEAAGGWNGRSLVEDQDLSFRAAERGWHGLRADWVEVEGELPADFRALRFQRQRWSAGSTQIVGLVPEGVLTRLSVLQRVIMRLQLLSHGSLYMALGALIVLAMLTWGLGLDVAPEVGWLLAGAVTLVVVTKDLAAAAGSLRAGRILDLVFIVDLLAMWAVQIALLPFNVRAQVKAMLRLPMKFKRTPKQGCEVERGILIGAETLVTLKSKPRSTSSPSSRGILN